jgi:hypothetical protein
MLHLPIGTTTPAPKSPQFLRSLRLGTLTGSLSVWILRLPATHALKPRAALAWPVVPEPLTRFVGLHLETRNATSEWRRRSR